MVDFLRKLNKINMEYKCISCEKYFIFNDDMKYCKYLLECDRCNDICNELEINQLHMNNQNMNGI